MTSIDNKELVVRLWYEELWNKWNLSAADELFSADYQLHIPGIPVPLDRNGAKQVVTMFSGSFPDLTHTVDEVIAEGNTVAARWTVTGTHRGEFQGIPASGKCVQLSGITVHHLADGRVRETWLAFDAATLLQQIGTSAAAATA
jgi:steroid delta-isomerase-like uncharacterized protein